MLRLSGPPAFAPLYLVPAFAAFLAAHPNVSALTARIDRSPRSHSRPCNGRAPRVHLFVSEQLAYTRYNLVIEGSRHSLLLLQAQAAPSRPNVGYCDWELLPQARNESGDL